MHSYFSDKTYNAHSFYEISFGVIVLLVTPVVICGSSSKNRSCYLFQITNLLTHMSHTLPVYKTKF